ncbi:MAG: adenosylcobinamide-phosphate synthase CbiB, partial [Thermodesulfobacteriota bacterium]
YAGALTLIAGAGLLGLGSALAVSVWLAFTTLSARGLYDETWRAARALAEGDLPRARKLLGLVVGRDTERLDRAGVLRALLETVAENLSDGVVAPLFYMALGGPALGLAYKAVNTLDSMIGYKDERFLHLGWAAAKLDDAANFIPARLAAALVAAAAWILGLDARGALHTWLEHGGRHTSPNAGRPEAALAGALGVRLGGPSTYRGRWVEKPVLGFKDAPLTIAHVHQAERMIFLAGGLMVLLILIGEAAW